MRQILESPEGRMKLVGAIWELETGRVRFSNKVCSTFKIEVIRF